MNIPALLWRNMLYRKGLSLLTVFAIGLTVALIVFLMLVSAGVEKGAEKGYGPFELIVGADGSESQLALNSFYHVGTPTGNIPFQVYEGIRSEGQTDAAFAMTTGDNYNGFPIVGIDPGYFPVRYGDKKLAAGHLYAKTGEAVIGSYVAKEAGLKVGDTFHGGHGLVEEAGHADATEEGEAGHEEHGKFVYKVTGILPALHTPDDRAVFTTLDYAWAVHHTESAEHREVTAVMVKPKSLPGAQSMKLKYDKLDNVQAVYTSKAVSDVVNAVDKGSQVIEVVTALCIVLAAITLLLSLIAAVNERKRDVGLLRLIGKTRLYVWLALMGEGLLLSAAGLVLGILLGHAGSYFATDTVFGFAGIQLDALRIPPGEIYLAAGTLLLGTAASLGPAMRMYRVDPLQLFHA